MTSLTDPDTIFQALAEVYDGLADEEVAGFHARLILLLIAEVGDDAAIHAAIRAAAKRPVRDG